MKHSDFIIGATFFCGDSAWRCTDVGTRTIIAMRIEGVEVTGTAPRTLLGSEAEAEGWFKGPPYTVSELVFDEHDIEACSPQPITSLQFS